MKYFKIYLFISIVALNFLVGCKKDEVTSIKKEFSIKDIDGKEVTSLPIDLLASIHQDLLNKNRTNDAAKLYELYDQKTGVLKSAIVNQIVSPVPFSEIKIDSTQMVHQTDTIPSPALKSWAQQYVYLYAHVQNIR
jgi:hypothetical protein